MGLHSKFWSFSRPNELATLGTRPGPPPGGGSPGGFGGCRGSGAPASGAFGDFGRVTRAELRPGAPEIAKRTPSDSFPGMSMMAEAVGTVSAASGTAGAPNRRRLRPCRRLWAPFWSGVEASGQTCARFRGFASSTAPHASSQGRVVPAFHPFARSRVPTASTEGGNLPASPNGRSPPSTGRRPHLWSPRPRSPAAS